MSAAVAATCLDLWPTAPHVPAQAKRVNIAIALVTHPRVLFLDEP
jgi:ABC-type branched-subunit amino acid transport system ATPase component